MPVDEQITDRWTVDQFILAPTRELTWQLFNETANLLAQRGGWTQNLYARDINGCRCDTSSPRALSFCLLGGLVHIADKIAYPRNRAWYAHSTPYWPSIMSRALTSVIGPSFTLFNDDPNRTQNEVVAALRQAASTVLSN